MPGDEINISDTPFTWEGDWDQNTEAFGGSSRPDSCSSPGIIPAAGEEFDTVSIPV